MSLLTLAIVNGALVVALLAGLVYVCAIPFRIDRPKPVRRAGRSPAPQAAGIGRAAASPPAGATASR